MDLSWGWPRTELKQNNYPEFIGVAWIGELGQSILKCIDVGLLVIVTDQWNENNKQCFDWHKLPITSSEILYLNHVRVHLSDNPVKELEGHARPFQFELVKLFILLLLLWRNTLACHEADIVQSNSVRRRRRRLTWHFFRIRRNFALVFCRAMRDKLGDARHTTLIANSIVVHSDHTSLRLCECGEFYFQQMVIYLVITHEPVYHKYARRLPLSKQHCRDFNLSPLINSPELRAPP